MRTQSEIKRNNIRKANLILESKQKTNRGEMASKFGLYEQCGVGPRDTEGIYMGAPTGTEPQLNFGRPNNLPIDIDWQGDITVSDLEGEIPSDMDDEMMMIFMQERENVPNPNDDIDPPTKPEEENDYEEIDHSDRDEFDGRKSRVVGVDSNIKKQRKLKENYKAVSAQPLFNTWGNRYNQILNEESKVNGAKSLMERMKKVIK